MQRGLRISIRGGSRLIRESLAQRLRRESGVVLVDESNTQGPVCDVLLLVADDASCPLQESLGEGLPESMGVVCVGGSPSLASTTLDWVAQGRLTWLESDASYDVLWAAVQQISQRRATVSPQMLLAAWQTIGFPQQVQPSDEKERPCLTNRETQVARLAAQGLINKEIARALGVQVTTVKTHLQAIFKKLQVRRRGDVHERHDASHAARQRASHTTRSRWNA